jgi:hypothetical protein
MHILFAWKARNLLSTWATVSFRRRTLFHDDRLIESWKHICVIRTLLCRYQVSIMIHKREIDAVCCLSHAEMKLRILDQVGTETLAHVAAIEPLKWMEPAWLDVHTSANLITVGKRKTNLWYVHTTRYPALCTVLNAIIRHTCTVPCIIMCTFVVFLCTKIFHLTFSLLWDICTS